MMQDVDQDETTSDDEKPSISESISSHAGLLGEPLGRLDTTYGPPTPNVASLVTTFAEEIRTVRYLASNESEISAPHGSSFQEDFQAQMQRITERHPEGLLVWQEIPNKAHYHLRPSR